MNCNSAIKIGRGLTYTHVYRWGAEPLVYKAIAAKIANAPLTLTVTAHGMPDGWFAAVTDTDVEELDAAEWPPKGDSFAKVRVLDVNTIAFNAIDLTRLDGTYATGGSVAYLTPVSLAGASASFTVYDSSGSGTPVLTSAAVLDDTGKTITVTLADTDTEDLTESQYTYALEAIDGDGNVVLLDSNYLTPFTPGVDIDTP